MADQRANCPDCGHGASEHRKGRSACRHSLTPWGTKADESKPPTSQAVAAKWGSSFHHWECGCKNTPEQIRTMKLGEQCEHCNGTGRKS